MMKNNYNSNSSIMGKGGESIITCKDKCSAWALSKKAKLEKLNTEELRKWAKNYSVVCSDEREVLLNELIPYADGIVDKDRPISNFPLEPPKFTLKEIKDAIPAHCFKRNLFTSLTHLAHDLILIAIIGYLGTFIGKIPFLPSWQCYVLWPIYWFVQGTVFTGVWVLAHECGHQAFSESEFWNNFFGTILHSLLLVPYHSWRITHGLHHSNTGSCDNDEVFNPATRSDWGQEMLRETPLAQIWGILIMLLVGWPGYLILNVTGPSKYRGKNANHFSPSAAFFKPNEYWLIVQSDIAFFVCLGLLFYCISVFGMGNVFYYYFVPYLVTNYHLVLITYLQHTDVFVPHFRGKEWNWLRGALCTVDRSFGVVLDHCFHHIADTHVCHHLFSKIPFYHAEEATQAIKKVIGPYYLRDETLIAKALWRSYYCCQYVEDKDTVIFYKNVK